MEEEDDDGQLYWDPVAGELRAVSSKPTETESSEPTETESSSAEVAMAEGGEAPPTPDASDVDKKMENGKEEEEEEEESSEEEEEEVVDVNAKSVFDRASTPQLIEGAIRAGGDLEKSVIDKWVGDEATGLYFFWNSGEKKMFCWNPSNGTMYEWQGAGKMQFLWQSQPGAVPGAAPAGAAVAAPQQADAQMVEGEEKVLWLTPIAPQFLWPVVNEVTVVWDIPSKVVPHLVGKAGAGIQALRDSSGCEINLEQKGKHNGALSMTGTKQQINVASNAVDQILAKQLGAAAVGNLKKKRDIKHQKELQKADHTQDDEIPGLPEFASKWKLDSKSLKKFKKHDIMMRKYVLKHFNPKVSKARGAIRKYTEALLRAPQRWRLEAMQEEALLEGECETTVVLDSCVIGKFDESLDTEETRLDLEAPSARQYGDVQLDHCRILNMVNDFYVLPLESNIGTVVDGMKRRSSDGPQPLRDGSVIDVGKYMVYCEIGTSKKLQERRQKLMAGDLKWGGKSATADAEKEAEEKAEEGEKELDEEKDDDEETKEKETETPTETEPSAEVEANGNDRGTKRPAETDAAPDSKKSAY